MEDLRIQTKQYVDGSSVELITKFDTIFNANSIEIEKQIKALEVNIQTAINQMGQNGGGYRVFYWG